MSENADTTNDNNQDNNNSTDATERAGKAESGFKPVESQEALDKIIEHRLARERAKYSDYDDLKTKASKLDEIEDAKKTDAQRSAEKIAELEKKLTSAQLEKVRTQVAAEHHLDAGLLSGSSEEEITAQAEKIAEAIKAAAPKNSKKFIVPGEGAGQHGAQSLDWLRDALTKRR